ncbi:kinase-like protein [Ascobolus immersus RN42]|uniref:Kinase-like protein n=1 Tax=Ascobolus immersus RN42 TaxID=1160509 RepID=A0A3N4I5T5_ASCIM|nr:kinase-like protein [Ascobolus immersus RN42]
MASSDSTVRPFNNFHSATSYHFPRTDSSSTTTPTQIPPPLLTESPPQSTSITPPSPSFLNTPPGHQAAFQTFYITSPRARIEHPDYYESKRLFPLHINDVVSGYDCSIRKHVGLENDLKGAANEYVILDKLRTMEGSMVWLAGRKDDEGRYMEDGDKLVMVHVRRGYADCEEDMIDGKCSEEQKVWERLIDEEDKDDDIGADGYIDGKRYIDIPLEGFVKKGPNGLNYFTVHELCGCDLANGSFYSTFLRRWLGKAHNAVRLTAEVAKGLAWLHSKGVVHGDISLPNILLAPDELTGWPTKTVDIAYGLKKRLCSHQVHRFDGSTPGPEVPRYILCDDHQLQKAFIHTLSRTVSSSRGSKSPPAPSGTAFAKISNFTYSFLLPTPTASNPKPTPPPSALPRTIGYRNLDYAPPEVLLNTPEQISPASDVWALGCVIFKLITGQEIFGDVDADDRLKVMCKHCFVFGRDYGMAFFRRWFNEGDEVTPDGSPRLNGEEEFQLPAPMFGLDRVGTEIYSRSNSYTPSRQSSDTFETTHSHSASSTPTPASEPDDTPILHALNLKFPLLSPLAPDPPLALSSAEPETQRRINPTFLLKQEIKQVLQSQELVTIEDMVRSSRGVRLSEDGIERVMEILQGCFRLEPGERWSAERIVGALEGLMGK